jgi:hypothetical protein
MGCSARLGQEGGRRSRSPTASFAAALPPRHPARQPTAAPPASSGRTRAISGSSPSTGAAQRSVVTSRSLTWLQSMRFRPNGSLSSGGGRNEARCKARSLCRRRRRRLPRKRRRAAPPPPTPTPLCPGPSALASPPPAAPIAALPKILPTKRVTRSYSSSLAAPSFFSARGGRSGARRRGGAPRAARARGARRAAGAPQRAGAPASIRAGGGAGGAAAKLFRSAMGPEGARLARGEWCRGLARVGGACGCRIIAPAGSPAAWRRRTPRARRPSPPPSARRARPPPGGKIRRCPRRRAHPLCRNPQPLPRLPRP